MHEKFLQGQLKRYRLRYFSAGDERRFNRYFEVGSEHVSYFHRNKIPLDLDIGVSVEAETYEGHNESLKLETMLIPRAGKGLLFEVQVLRSGKFFPRFDGCDFRFCKIVILKFGCMLSLILICLRVHAPVGTVRFKLSTIRYEPKKLRITLNFTILRLLLRSQLLFYPFVMGAVHYEKNIYFYMVWLVIPIIFSVRTTINVRNFSKPGISLIYFMA